MFSITKSLKYLHQMHKFERPESVHRIFYLLMRQGKGKIFANNYGVFFESETGMIFRIDTDWLYQYDISLLCNVIFSQTQVDLLTIACNEFFTISDKWRLENLTQDWYNLNEICPEKAAEVLQRILKEYPTVFSYSSESQTGHKFYTYVVTIQNTACSFRTKTLLQPTDAAKGITKYSFMYHEEYVGQILFELALDLV